MATQIRATIDDLYHVPEHGKAELVDGELALMSPTGWKPNYAAAEIFVSLRSYVKRVKRGMAIPDNAAFLVTLPNRQSFSPDAAFYVGPNPGMKFFQGAPQFAVEVRSEGDYGPTAEVEMAAKRADYFAAGTLIVWDVDLLCADVVRAFSPSDPNTPRIFHRGEMADAEPAVLGWSMPVDDLFE